MGGATRGSSLKLGAMAKACNLGPIGDLLNLKQCKTVSIRSSIRQAHGHCHAGTIVELSCGMAWSVSGLILR
jgi:hypothetical protein